jgi:hypothetical protein
MDEIEVVGAALEEVSFDLARLRDNVLEMPVGFCLDLLSTGELLQIQRALHLYGLVEPDTPTLEGRDALLSMLSEEISSEGYYGRALEQCTNYALALLRIIAVQGGTSSSLVAIEKSFGERFNELYYYPSHRCLARLGLAYAVDSATRPYYLLPEGVVDALWRQSL